MVDSQFMMPSERARAVFQDNGVRTELPGLAGVQPQRVIPGARKDGALSKRHFWIKNK